MSSGSCSASENCNPTTGVCTDIVPECANLDAGAHYCSNSDEVAICGPNLVSREVVEACSGRCSVTTRGAACVPASCGDGKEQLEETCDDGNDDNDDDCTELCLRPFCGDGFQQAGETCDDAGESESCDDDCTPASCGDERTNEAAGEDCDDGDQNNDDECTELCLPPHCGDGIQQAVEACDDGEESATCDDDCTPRTCGDGTTNGTAGEDCDDGGDSPDCDADCSFVACGDAHLNAPADEVCESVEPGGSPESATCDDDCSAPACGDGATNALFQLDLLGSSDIVVGEECDPDSGSTGNAQRATSDSATCDRDCTFPRCGDGYLNATSGEECDDEYVDSGPKTPTADCDSDCTPAACGDSLVNPEFTIRFLYNDSTTFVGEQCDPGTGTDPVDPQRALDNTEGCDRDCTVVRCGDGSVNAEAGEECDATAFGPGSIPPATPSCDSDCTFPECGDGFENIEAGEECDDGNTNSGDGCDALCQDE